MVPGWEVMERGVVTFVVQPRVEHHEIVRLADVQRTLMILGPEGPGPWRRVLLGHKRLPLPGRKERFWSYIDRVGAPRELTEDLGPRTYETRTRGTRHQPGALPIARGPYVIVHHAGHTHFQLTVDPQRDVRPVREIIRLGPRASFLLLAMRPPLGGRGSWEWRTLPEDVKARFGDARFADARGDLLSREGMSVVLIPVSWSATAWEAGALAGGAAPP